MYAFTKVGHLVQLCIIFWPHFIIKILGRFGRPKFACQPISKNIFSCYAACTMFSFKHKTYELMFNLGLTILKSMIVCFILLRTEWFNFFQW